MRRPSISTRVRREPSWRRFRVAVPFEPFTRVTLCAANACGSWFTRSSMRLTPWVTTSAAVICVTGVVASRFADLMREPVTMISPRFSCASAGAATPAAVTALMMSARRTADATRLLRSIVYVLPGTAEPFVVSLSCHVNQESETPQWRNTYEYPQLWMRHHNNIQLACNNRCKQATSASEWAGNCFAGFGCEAPDRRLSLNLRSLISARVLHARDMSIG